MAKTMLKRGAGILMPVSSLPSPYGIGTFGACAYEFADKLVKARQSYWQVLPLGPTSYGDSPYQPFPSLRAIRILLTWTCWPKRASSSRKNMNLSTGKAPLAVSITERCTKSVMQCCTKPVPACWQRPRRITPISWRKTRSGCRTMPCSWP